MNKIEMSELSFSDKYDMQYILSDIPYSEGKIPVKNNQYIDIISCDEIKIKSEENSKYFDYLKSSYKEKIVLGSVLNKDGLMENDRNIYLLSVTLNRYSIVEKVKNFRFIQR